MNKEGIETVVVLFGLMLAVCVVFPLLAISSTLAIGYVIAWVVVFFGAIIYAHRLPHNYDG